MFLYCRDDFQQGAVGNTPHCRLDYCNITHAGLAALLAGMRASPSRLEYVL